MTKFAEMDKNELRAACKAAGIKYSKMNNDQMREALAFEATPEELAAQKVRPVHQELDNGENYEAKKARIAATIYTPEERESMGEAGVEMVDGDDRGHCPDCGIHLSNGLAHYADICDTDPKGAGKMVYEWTCLGCGGEWGVKLRHNRTANRATGTGLKIEKNREMKNGIKRPSVGGKCRAVWDALDAQAATGTIPVASVVKELADKNGWNKNNAMIEFYQWRKFNGYS